MQIRDSTEINKNKKYSYQRQESIQGTAVASRSLNNYKGVTTMKQNLINDVVQAMLPYLNNEQAERLQIIMQHELFNYEVLEKEAKDKETELNLVELFYRQKGLKVVLKSP